MKKIFLIIYGFLAVLVTARVSAQTPPPPSCPTDQIPTEFGCATGIVAYFNQIMAWAVPIVGSIAVLMFIYAGYLYMTSQGNQEKTGLAKEIIIGVITGILLLFTVEILLTNVIGSHTGQP